MTDIPDHMVTDTPGAAPEELPPVQPPSAGFIMQLFLIPAIIVIAVVGVWVLFGKLAGAEQDWKQLVQDLGSENEHRRWRAASGLAHLLNADNQRWESMDQLTPPQREAMQAQEPLASNPEIARELVRLFNSQLDKRKSDDKLVTHQDFLARTLGMLDQPETVLPALQRAVEGDFDVKVRATALSSIALVTARAAKRGDDVKLDPVVTTLIDSSGDPSALIRQYSAYGLGLLPTDAAAEHLKVMLSDADDKVRLNAAIALAREGDAEGFDVFVDVLADSDEKLDMNSLRTMTDEERVAALNRYQVEQPLMLKNTIKALSELTPGLSEAQKTRAVSELKPIAAEYENTELRKRAADLMSRMGEVR